MPVPPSNSLDSKSTASTPNPPPLRPMLLSHTPVVIPLGAWELRDSILSPTRCHLQEHARRLQSQSSTDPLIAILLTPPYLINDESRPQTRTVHRSLLRSASFSLQSLIPSDTATTSSVKEWPDTFNLIRKFLYLEPIDLSTAPSDLPLAAARWRLKELFEACFAYAERSLPFKMSNLLWIWMPVLRAVRVPEPFKTAFALTFVAAVDEQPLRKIWLSSTGTRGDWSKEPDENGMLPICDCMHLESPQTPIALSDTPSDAQLIHSSVTLRNRRKDPCQKQCAAMSVWTVFHTQGMLEEIITYLLRFGTNDYGSLVLDVLLRQLEPLLSDVQLTSLLRKVEWNENYNQLLYSEQSLLWSSRAWQKLMQTRDSSAQLEIVRISVTMQEIKHALSEPGSRAVRWESDRAIYNTGSGSLQIIASVSCESRKSRRVPPLLACVRVTNGDVRPVSKSRVRADVSYVSLCSCEIRGNPGSEAGKRVELPDDLTINSFTKIGGVGFRVLDGSALRGWIDEHDVSCGLKVIVNLAVENDRGCVEKPESTEDRWLQHWQLKCPCGHCHTQSRKTEAQANLRDAMDRSSV